MAIVYLPHGGGPLPLLGDPAHAPLVEALKSVTHKWPRPVSILVISAHWEAPVPTLTASALPGLLYDYSGFPPESYRIGYPAPGAPERAENIARTLGQQGIEARLETQRGWDHGVFVPLKLMYPEADIPVIQCALVGSLDAEQHLRLGEALRAAVADDMLVIGSGFSFHNLRAFGQIQAQATCCPCTCATVWPGGPPTTTSR